MSRLTQFLPILNRISLSGEMRVNSLRPTLLD